MKDQNKALPTQGEWQEKKEALIRLCRSNVDYYYVKNHKDNNVEHLIKGLIEDVERHHPAIKNTYGKGLDPTQYEATVQALKDVRSQIIDAGNFTEDSVFIKAIDLHIEKTKL